MTVRNSAHAWRDAALSVLLASVAVLPAMAEPEPQPAAQIATLDHALLETMQHAQQLGFKGRYAKLQPIVQQIYDVPMMTQIAVGSGWAELTQEQQHELSEAFGNFIAATYAQRFDGYAGEKFVETGTRPIAGGVMVNTQLIKADGDPIELNYLTRQIDGKWQVVDVFLTGTISELATRRSEFSGVFRTAGYQGLLQTLQQKVAQLETPAHLS